MAAAKKPRRWCRCIDHATTALAKQSAEMVLSFTWDGHCRAIVATQKKMGSPRRTRLIHLIATFCPFCGKEYPEPKAKKG